MESIVVRFRQALTTCASSLWGLARRHDDDPPGAGGAVLDRTPEVLRLLLLLLPRRPPAWMGWMGGMVLLDSGGMG